MTDLHAISNENEYDAAIEEIEELWGAALGTPARNRLQLLTIFVESYESVHHVIEPPNPIGALKYAMEKNGNEGLRLPL